jgi:hypothetical protein
MNLELHKPIETTVVVKPAVNAAVQYMIVNFSEDEWGVARVLLLDDENNAIAAHDMPITLEESEAWEGDDMYILKIALEKLGISSAVAPMAMPR